MSTGGSPTIQQSTTVLIASAPDEVWDYVSDLGKTPTWRTTVTSIQPPAALEVGQQFTGTTRLLGRTWKWTLELTEVEPGRGLRYCVREGIVKLDVRYRVEPDRDGTRFTMTGAVVQFGLAGRLLRPFAQPALRRETAAHLENLRQILEAR